LPDRVANLAIISGLPHAASEVVAGTDADEFLQPTT
jgi:hypothetical protein